MLINVKTYSQISTLMNNVPPGYMNKALLKANLSQKQWEAVKFINEALIQEYECRRQMLLKRLDVTIQSFRWGDKAMVSSYLIS